MAASFDASIIPIILTVNGKTGLTLYALPWEDEDGEEWQGFLGDGAKILLYPDTRSLAEFIASGEENDLSDHPAWARVLQLTPADLRPTTDDVYDVDAVYEWAAQDPDVLRQSALANVVDMVGRIADCCDDGRLRALVQNTPEYDYLVSDEASYMGRDGKREWSALGKVITETWERAISRLDSWLEWVGDFSEVSPDLAELASPSEHSKAAEDEEEDEETFWESVGAEPIEIVIGDERLLTIRGEINDDEVVFLTNGEDIAVAASPAALGAYVRDAEEHGLEGLENWDELADIDPAGDNLLFEPATDATFDLTEPSERGEQLLLELADYCDLATEDLSEPLDEEDWHRLLPQVRDCLQVQK